ncbi:HAD family phosphatase [Falcatimonas sp. MSJ-15]|uniref:HAD family hydrolase n=1 Tax=Falcatimonas sp. MSJ-15 TaxID=2841515 RepID=UPI001C1045CB|nr:HAD family phosphatase [Falcatimonas sp. MSJ-15]MBU5470318.1 HAD family phosphatase [Falcatimonas sp. MSJ-15]
MLKDIKAVIFDMDGTLIDSMWMWRDIDIEYLGKHNIELPEKLQKEIEGMSFTETANYFKENFNLKESIDEIKETWNNMARYKYEHEVGLKYGVKDFLSYLKDNGIKLGIATSNSRELVNAVSLGTGLNNYFDEIVTACEVNRGKPAPDIYLKVADELNVEPQECLVFEDVPMGILAGKNAGMQVCAVYDDYSKDVDSEKKELADYYINNYNDILSGKYEVLND